LLPIQSSDFCHMLGICISRRLMKWFRLSIDGTTFNRVNPKLSRLIEKCGFELSQGREFGFVVSVGGGNFARALGKPK